MASTSEILIKIKANVDDALTNMGKLNKGLDDMDKQVKNNQKNWDGLKNAGESMTKVGGAMTVGLTAPIVGLVGASVALGTEMSNNTERIERLAGSAENAAPILEEITKLGQTGGYGRDVYQQAAESLLNMGFAAKDVPGLLENIGNTAEASGKGAEGINSIVETLGKMNTTGTVSTKQLLELQSQGIPIFDILANKYGVTKDALAEMLNENDNAAKSAESHQKALKDLDDAEDALRKTTNQLKYAHQDLANAKTPEAAEKARDKIEELTDTMGEQQETVKELKDTIANYSEDSQESVIKVADVFSEVTTSMEKNSGALDKAATEPINKLKDSTQKIQDAMAAMGEKMMPIIGKLFDAFEPIINVVIGIMDAFTKLDPNVQTIILAILGLIAALGPILIIFGQLAIAISALAPVITFLTSAALAPMIASFLAAAAPIIAIIAVIALLVAAFLWAYDNIGWFRDGVNAILGAVAGTFDYVFKNIGVIVEVAISQICNVLDVLKALLNGDLTGAIQGLGKVWDGVWSGMKSLLNSLGIAGIVEGIINAAIGVINGFIDGYNKMPSQLQIFGHIDRFGNVSIQDKPQPYTGGTTTGTPATGEWTKYGMSESTWNSLSPRDKKMIRDEYNQTGGAGVSTPAPSTGGGGCFVAGTLITMGDGTEKPIEEIEVGDIVLSFAPDTLALTPREVLETYIHEGCETYKLYFDDGSVIEATGVHPFRLTGNWKGRDYIHDYFVAVADLRPGDIAISLGTEGTEPKPCKVLGIEYLGGNHRVYNFNVEGNHTYIAGGMFVHNYKTFAEGGIITSEINGATVGEAGPEAIIPLDRLPSLLARAGIGGPNNGTMVIQLIMDGDIIGEALASRNAKNIRVNLGVR